MSLSRIRQNRLVLALIVGWATQPFTVGAVTSAITSAQIIASALSPQCMEYKVVGICYWLFCTPVGCTVKTSVKVHHFIPNAVVSSYNEAGGNPWVEVAFMGPVLPGIADGGGANEQKRSRRKDNLHFKNADAIGHPALASPAFNNFTGQMGYTCASSATPMMPYLLSTLDAVVWRSGLPESFFPEAITPGLREIGSTVAGSMWGNVYPRSGFVTQTNDYKAAAVVAQRAADIITRVGQLHVYQPMVDMPKPGYWPPFPVLENTGMRNHKWQRLTPMPSMTCAVFPDITEITNINPLSLDGNYAWALWQPYSCCKQMGQTFLYSTGAAI
ncbi:MULTISPECIES: TIGR03756 family integrating conjugative element protein [unclassified Escherichia]|uniref:TIGR03756 family integrating conjugative element protein n=1 Tax=unclassified Escherichia TaxID=2608889 RepID=UPI0010811BEC|nr:MULTISPECIES: TIGR03756 family integrating conjugative element protein [unclassified Escherichia]QCT87987.1 TIGR03756 family integrating conjugative element protein [Escherichia sp. E4742]TGB55538.1 TIGR03756 family integrating conjugative element protein [Escherichia sp. E4742]TGB81620.1 TIGR03756 family integrating conjugative element protein [Escherichia sp. E3659]TLJ03371.1 TIGR03756 family integrating conjugative element protein [Escherichia sp. E3659]TLJ07217.1 TIGR03756 family integr